MKTHRTLPFIIAAAAGAASVATASEPYVISDENSVATFSDSGQVSWLVDGVEQIFTQEFHFRRSSDNQELRVGPGALELLATFSTDTNPFKDDSIDTFGSLFSDGNGLQIETVFTLRGGTDGSGTADLSEQIVLRNTSQETLSLTFFQYVDFDLGGDADDDFGQIINGQTVRQSDDEFSVSEVVVSPQPTEFQVDDAAVLSALLTDDSVDTLNGQAVFQGDAGWAFQWDITLTAGDTFIISKDKSIVPAPGALALLLASAGVLTRRRGS